MELKTKYQTTFDGKTYSILKVPIFKTTEDEERGTFNITNLREIVKNFNKGVKNDWYPRIFIGHHDPNSTENRLGVGFLDNLVYEDEVIYADFVKINRDVFEDIKNLKYPYRSVEIKKDTKEIRGLALLESQPPYFSFPILNVSNYSEKDLSYFCMMEQIYMDKFKKQDEKEVTEKTAVKEKEGVGKFPAKPEKEDQTPREKDGPVKENEKFEKKEDENGDEENLAEEKKPDMLPRIDPTSGLDIKIDKLTKLVEKLLMMEIKEDLNKQPTQEGKTMQIGTKPGSISMQDEQKKDNLLMQDEVTNLKNKVLDLTIENKLNSMFSENNVREYHKNILKMIATEQKENYLNLLDKEQTFDGNFQEHPAKKILSASKKDGLNNSSLLSKYSDEPQTIRRTAKEALESWSETMNHPNEKYRQLFQSYGWSKPEDFVDHVVSMEKIQPNYLKTLTM